MVAFGTDTGLAAFGSNSPESNRSAGGPITDVNKLPALMQKPTLRNQRYAEAYAKTRYEAIRPVESFPVESRPKNLEREDFICKFRLSKLKMADDSRNARGSRHPR